MAEFGDRLSGGGGRLRQAAAWISAVGIYGAAQPLSAWGPWTWLQRVSRSMAAGQVHGKVIVAVRPVAAIPTGRGGGQSGADRPRSR